MKFSIKDFLSKCDQIRSFLRIWSDLLKKSLIENFIFCAMYFWILWYVIVITSIISKDTTWCKFCCKIGNLLNIPKQCKCYYSGVQLLLKEKTRYYKAGTNITKWGMIVVTYQWFCAVQYNSINDFFYSMKWWFFRAVFVNGLWKDKRFQKITVFADSHVVAVTWYPFNFKFSKLTLIWMGPLGVCFEVGRG